jgi:hypothetical protein
MGLPIHKTTRTPAKVAKTAPCMNVVIKVVRHLTFEFGESETSRAKPAGQHEIEFVYVISAEKPTDISQLTNFKSNTRTPIDIDFDEEDRGKSIWFAARWKIHALKPVPGRRLCTQLSRKVAKCQEA